LLLIVVCLLTQQLHAEALTSCHIAIAVAAAGGGGGGAAAVTQEGSLQPTKSLLCLRSADSEFRSSGLESTGCANW